LAYIGKVPANAPLTSSDIADGIISTADIANTAVTGSKVNTDVISAQTALATAPADTDEFLVSDAGVIKRIDYSLIKGGGITMADQYRMSANRDSDEDPIDSGVERVDGTGQGFIGTGMTYSSGIFTFPSTGVYLVKLVCSTARTSSDDNAIDVKIMVSTDTSNYSTSALSRTSGATDPSTMMGYAETLIDVTNTSLFRVKFVYASSNSNRLFGDTGTNRTTFTFIRLGDT